MLREIVFQETDEAPPSVDQMVKRSGEVPPRSTRTEAKIAPNQDPSYRQDPMFKDTDPFAARTFWRH